MKVIGIGERENDIEVRLRKETPVEGGGSPQGEDLGVGEKGESPLDMGELVDGNCENDRVHVLTKEELDEIGREERVKFDQGRATPLFLVGRVETGQGQKKFAMELDGGSDRCLCPLSLAKQLGLEVKRFQKDKDIMGVGGTKIYCTHYTVLRLWFKTKGGKRVKMTLLAYLLDTDIPVLLGNDALGKLGAVISYDTSTLLVGGNEIELCNSRVDLKRIMTERTDFVYVQARDECIIPGNGCQLVDVVLTENVEGTLALVGYEDEHRFPLSTVWEERGEEGLQMIVINKKKLPLTIKRGERIGFVACQNESVCLVRLNEVIEDIKEKGGEKAYKVGVGEEVGCEIPDRRRLTPGELDHFFEKGATVKPLEGEIKELGKIGELENIDRAKEREKHKKSKMWEDKDEFLSLFKWDDMVKELEEDLGLQGAVKYTEEWKEMFWAYRSIFWNGLWSMWGKAKVPDFEIEVIPGTGPKIDKFRRISPEKAEVLRKYVEDMIAGGVIERCANNSSSYICNPLILGQLKRYPDGPKMAYRFCLDARAQNSVVKTVTCKLRLMDELLEECSNKGKFFVSFDMCNYYHQISLGPSSRDLTAFYNGNLGVYRFTTPQQGGKNSPNFAQALSDHVTDHCNEVVSYIDDYLSYSLSLEGLKDKL